MNRELRADKLRNRIRAISSFYYQKGRMPSFSEIAEMTGFRSKNAVYKLINKIEKLKVLGRDSKGRLIAGSIAATKVILFLRTKEFRDTGIEVKLTRPTAYPSDLFRLLREGFQNVYRPHSYYRKTGLVLARRDFSTHSLMTLQR